MRKKLSLLIGIIPVAAVVAAISYNSLRSVNVLSAQSTQSPNNIQNTSSQNSYTLNDIKQHNTSASCWTAINGKVYDLTNFISRHPGGPDTILQICGIDGSAGFNAQHGNQRKPNRELNGFYIGTLK